MDIDKFVRITVSLGSDTRFGSLMDIDKFVQQKEEAEKTADCNSKLQ